jgi:hypothetical protein
MKKATLEDQIRSYLRAFPAEDVERFMLSMKMVLVGNAWAPRGKGSADVRRTDLRRTMDAAAAFKKISMDSLSGDFRRPLILDAVVSIVDTGALEQFKSGFGGEQSPLFEAWTAMMPYLNSFIRELNDEIARKRPKSRGRKQSSSDGTLRLIGAIYTHIFGELPSSTEGSAFYNIAVKILRQKNVQRPVQAAIASLKGDAQRTKLPRK